MTMIPVRGSRSVAGPERLASSPLRREALPDTVTVDIVVHNGCNGLEAIGASSVFTYANTHLERRGRGGRYDVKFAAVNAGPVASDAGVALVAGKRLDPLAVPHTTLVAGGWNIEASIAGNPAIVEWLRHAGARGSRMAGLSGGAFFLADAGLLNGKQATTHWTHADRLKGKHPEVSIPAACIFVRDGRIWTSAGVAAGIDLALAIVEQDFGPDIALDVARDLVIYARRPGSQSQLSVHLSGEPARHHDIRAVQHWVLENIGKDVTAADMAGRVATSLRSFNRRFKEATGATPTAFLTRARVEAARRILEESDLPAKTIASRTGFKTYEAMRRAFHGALGVTPIAYRERWLADAPGG